MGEEQNLSMEAIGGSRLANFIMGKINNWRENRQSKQKESESESKSESKSSVTKIPWWVNPTDAAVMSMG